MASASETDVSPFCVVYGWRLVDLQSTPAALARAQFEIKHLFLLTAGVAVVLGFAKRSIPVIDQFSIGMVFWEPIVIFATLIFFNTVITLPILLSMLTEPVRLRWLIAGFLVTLAVTGVEPAAVGMIIRGVRMEESEVTFLWFMNAIQAAWLYGILSVVRACGYRLVRRL